MVRIASFSKLVTLQAAHLFVQFNHKISRKKLVSYAVRQIESLKSMLTLKAAHFFVQFYREIRRKEQMSSEQHLGYKNGQLVAAHIALSVKYLTFGKQSKPP